MAAELRRALEAVGAAVHDAGSLPQARALARELIGPATVARWADAELDGIAEREAPPAEAEVSLVVAAAAVIETGAIALVHGPGRSRAAGVLPSRQVALLALEDVVDSAAEGLSRLGLGAPGPPASVVLVAGPSRSADIEQRVVRGVHGPRELDVILYRRGSP